jgi:hypothetical protein
VDPNQTWHDLSEAFGKDWEKADELADELLDWIERGGFPPKITENDEFDKCICRRMCEAIAAWDVF